MIKTPAYEGKAVTAEAWALFKEVRLLRAVVEAATPVVGWTERQWRYSGRMRPFGDRDIMVVRSEGQDVELSLTVGDIRTLRSALAALTEDGE